MLVRSQNPFAKHLASSDCIFEWGGDASKLDTVWYDQLKNLKGRLEELDGGRMRLTVPHASIDAFGGLYFLKKPLESAPKCAVSDEICEMQVGDHGFTFATFSFPNEAIPKTDQTLTQRFFGRLIRLLELEAEELSLIVSLDDLRLIDDSNFAGNSLSSVKAQAKRWRQVCESDAAVWRSFVQARAAHAVDMNRPVQASGPHLVLSSLGNIKKYPWCPDLGDIDFRMVPTPTHRETANVAVWSHGDTHFISLSALPEHPVFKDFRKIAQIWRGLFYAQ